MPTSANHRHDLRYTIVDHNSHTMYNLCGQNLCLKRYKVALSGSEKQALTSFLTNSLAILDHQCNVNVSLYDLSYAIPDSIVLHRYSCSCVLQGSLVAEAAMPIRIQARRKDKYSILWLGAWTMFVSEFHVSYSFMVNQFCKLTLDNTQLIQLPLALICRIMTPSLRYKLRGDEFSLVS